ncbi:long-chain-fatty-acid--CoA ligase [Natronorubrum halophilum]|uniref:long-chain-fatty-acid--CoA ligase n=1 Tax=Natronorubrum halophilum TaxID=1702106 RepID=UPI0010C1A499|nr:long-chain fatty acid--CoA ligase [Natronorubrum halophilum]
MTNLVRNVSETVESTPDSVAIADDDTELSYEAFWERAGRFARALADHDIGADDRVAIYLPNLPQFVTAFQGTLRAGGIVVPMNPQYKAREIAHLLSDSGARAVVTLSENVSAVSDVLEETAVERVISVGPDTDGATDFEDFLADDTLEIVDRADDDIAVQPYTSGTTGTPKGVLLTHDNLAWTANANSDLIGGIEPDDKLIGTLPLFHIYGMSVVMNGALFNGAAYHPVPEWDATAVMGTIESERITVMFGVPAMFNDMVNHPEAETYDLSSLRFVNSGGSSLPMDVLERFEETFGPALYEGYGLTETSPTTHANAPGARRKGSIGKPFDGMDAKVVDDEFAEIPRVEEGPINEGEVDLAETTGELVVSGPNVMAGYYGLPEANEEAFTEADGKTWFHTGDIGYWDEDDFFYVVDREKHMIVTGGYNVYPREVEELLFEHEDIADAAVVGVPDERRGETVKALVVPTPDAEIASEDIREYCLDNVAAYKHPREVQFVDELPRTTTGKVQKFKIRGE